MVITLVPKFFITTLSYSLSQTFFYLVLIDFDWQCCVLPFFGEWGCIPIDLSPIVLSPAFNLVIKIYFLGSFHDRE